MLKKALGLGQSVETIADTLSRAEEKRSDEDLVAGTSAWNDDMRLTFLAFGDDCKAPRRVLHFFDPAEGGATKEVVKSAFAWVTGCYEDHDEMENILFVQTRDIAPGDFDAMTQKMSATLAELNWEYFGWEATIVAEDN